MKSNKTLLLEKSDNYFIEENNGLQPLENLPFLNKINIFIGTNNSGKSKFMRYLMSLDRFLFLDENIFISLDKKIDKFNIDFKGRYSLLPNLKREYNIKDSIDLLRSTGHFTNYELPRDLKITTEIRSPKFYYIPTLRTAHSLYLQTKEEQNFTNFGVKYEYEKIEDDILLHTLRKNYSLDKDIEIFTGVHLYKDILNTRNSKRETRKLFENFERFISRNFFDGKAIDIIAEFDKDESRKGNNTKEIISIHIEGEKHSRDLYNLGDGIQALIILMYKIFMAKDNSYVFIDEPEINLHPGMQRLFLEQIIANPDLSKKNLTYFISTHSNHFLDLTLEKDSISIYSFSSKTESDGEKKLIIKNVNAGDNDVLKNIGVNNSSVFMANCSIWVEGVSDRIYIRAFLKSYCKHNGKKYPKEDIDFAFFEYAGTNLDHYLFDDIDEEEQEEMIKDINAMSLSNRIFLLADSDNVRADSKKGKRLAKLEDVKSDNFIPEIIRTHREIENFLPNSVWESILIELCNKKIISENREEIDEKIHEVLKNIDANNYSKKYIGEFLNDIRTSLGEIAGKFILNQSEYEIGEKGNIGTLKNKRALSELVAEKGFSWEILRKSKAIEKLTESIYKFIENK
ncbi:AAA ATPase domain-containing protein [Chryseobacterium ureilyticum]|uniref:AAA ATPase domain-containing protein n=1 Tax=Chryseobacterium ureilyticum TaxID=373668 RepID=A0A1N7PS15_9FLAO|nr:AAA family ATPase [Chryseobacterium ureilyticum]SIT13350.1 AAA ATPase domain-containing protein [Chryseobacterium ureilyticum]